MYKEDDLFDHPDDLFDGDVEPLSDDDAELFPLFAEALGPRPEKTVEQVEQEWRELFGEG